MPDSSLKKSAYVAVGIPAHLLSHLRDRIAAASEAVDAMRDRLGDEAQRAFDEWVEEGERLVTSFNRRLQGVREDVVDTVQEGRQGLRTGAATARDVGRGVVATLAEPIVPIDEIDGVGPAYAEKLATAGVISTRALLERCATDAARERLADQTGISAALLERWAESADLTRVNGIGDEHMTVLNQLGIGTMEALAAADAGDLHDRASAIDADAGLGTPVPAAASFARWITQAGRLVG
jgi:predicted flap endonuclease-1-like 5' DNA nuclease